MASETVAHAPGPRPEGDPEVHDETVNEAEIKTEHPRWDPRSWDAKRIACSPLLWLGVIMLIGAALRIIGFRWGLPLHLHPDEWVVVDGAVDMAKRNSFEPKYYMRPDHLEIKLNYLAYELYGGLHGTPPEVLFARDQAPFYAISRLVTALLGVLTIPVAYLIGSRLRPAAGTAARWTGVLAAAIFAFYPPFVEHAHFATPDVPLVLTSLLVVLACMLYIDKPQWRWLLAAAFAVALGFIAKYPAAIGGVIVAGSVLAAGIRDRAWRRTVLQGLAAPFLFLGSVFVLSPVLFTNFTAVRDNFATESRTTAPGGDGLSWFGNLDFYLKAGWLPLGLILSVFAVLGAVRLVRDRAVHALPILLGALMWLALSHLPLHWARWGLPMYITPLLLAPVGAFAFADWLGRWKPASRYARPVAAVLVGIALLNLLAGSASRVADFLVPNVRSVAQTDFDEKGITKKNAIFEGYTPLMPGAPAEIFKDFKVVDGQLELTPTAQARKAKYVVVGSGMSQRFMSDKVRFADQVAFYDALDEQFEKVGQWGPTGGAMPVASKLELLNIPRQLGNVGRTARGERTVGPVITVYRIPQDAR